MPNRVLPALFILPIVRKSVHDELIYSAKCYFLLWRALYSHGNERYVRVRRLDHLVSLMRHMLRTRNRRIKAILPCLILSVCGTVHGEMNRRIRGRSGSVKFIALISVHWRDHVVVRGSRVRRIRVHGHHGSCNSLRRCPL